MDDIERKIQGTINILRYVNPYLAEFLKWTRPPSFSRTTHYQLLEYQDVNLKLASQQYVVLFIFCGIKSGCHVNK